MMKMKRFHMIGVLILTLLGSAVLSVSAMAATAVASGYCGASGENLTWGLDSVGTLTISGSGKMKNYSEGFAPSWYSYRSGITKIAIDSGVTSIGSLAFYDCSSLTSINIPNSVTSIGSWAFQDCSSLTRIELPNSVTSIGVGAFADCRSLTSIKIPSGVTSIELFTFHGCSRLTSINIPSGVTSIGECTFDGCSSLTSIDIPSGVTSIGLGAFNGCPRLTSIKIPNSVTSIGEGAFWGCCSLTDVYYYGTEAQWGGIQIGGANSDLTNARIHFVAAASSAEVPKGKYRIHVVDGNGNPLDNVSILWEDSAEILTALTDRNGNADISVFTIGNPVITAEKSGYITWTNENSNWEKSSSRYETVVLYPTGAGEYMLCSARYSNSSLMTSSTDLLTRTKSLALSSKTPAVGDLDSGNFYIGCQANAALDKVDHYELYQGDKRIAESSFGFFSLSVDQFSKGGGCFIRVTAKDGRTADTHINLSFTESKINANTELSFGSGKLSVKVGDDVPFVGGSTVKFDLPLTSKLQLDVGEDKIKVGINANIYDKDGSVNADKIKELKETLEKTQKAGKMLKDKKTWSSVKALTKEKNKAQCFKDVEVYFIGYLEGDIGASEVTGCIGILIETKAVNFEYNTLLFAVVPVTVQVGLDLTGSAMGTVTYNWDTAVLGGKVAVQGSAELEAFGGFGASKWVSAGAYGSAEVDIDCTILGNPRGWQSVDLTGELGVKAYFLKQSYERAFAYHTWNLYKANNIKTTAAAAFLTESGSYYDEIYDASQYEEADLSYLAQESEWLGAADQSSGGVKKLAGANAAAKVSFNSLLENTYRNAQPTMVSDGETIFASFLRADAETGKVYCVVTKFDGTSWSTPVAVDPNSVLDDAPAMSIAADGTVWLTYAKTAAGEYSSLTDYAENQTIVVGTIDRNTLAFTESAAFSSADFPHFQQLEIVNGKPTLLWVESAITDDDSVLFPQSGKILTSVYEQGAWGAATVLTQQNKPVLSATLGEKNGNIAAAYTIDEDGDPATEDVNLYCSSGSQLLASGISTAAQFALVPGETEKAFVWNENGALCTSNGGKIPMQGITSDYSVVDNGIYYSAASDGGANLCSVLYQDGVWSAPIQLTDGSRYLENTSAAKLGADYIVLGMHTDVTISAESVTDSKNLVWSKVLPVSDIGLDSISYEEGSLTAGEATPLTLSISNHGDHTVSSIDILVDGTPTAVKTCSIAPGAEAELELTIECPSELTSYDISVRESGEQDYRTEDNKKELSIGYAELTVNAYCQKIGEKQTIIAAVVNTGIDTASGRIIAYNGAGEPFAYGSIVSLKSGDIAVVELETDSLEVGANGCDVTIQVTPDEEDLYQFNNTATLHIACEAAEEKTEINGMSLDDGTVSVSVYTLEEATLYCAFYDANGCLIEIQKADIAIGEIVKQFICTKEYASVQALLLDAQNVPLCSSKQADKE